MSNAKFEYLKIAAFVAGGKLHIRIRFNNILWI
jgi:hypothetical protein